MSADTRVSDERLAELLAMQERAVAGYQAQGLRNATRNAGDQLAVFRELQASRAVMREAGEILLVCRSSLLENKGYEGVVDEIDLVLSRIRALGAV